MVRCANDDVGIVGCQNRTAVVDLRANDEQRAFEQLDDLARQIAEIEFVLVDPRAPVVARAFEQRLRRARADQSVQPRDLVIGGSGGDPIVDHCCGMRGELNRAPDGGIDRTFGNRRLGKKTIFGIAPSPFGPLKGFAPGRKASTPSGASVEMRK